MIERHGEGRQSNRKILLLSTQVRPGFESRTLLDLQSLSKRKLDLANKKKSVTVI